VRNKYSIYRRTGWTILLTVTLLRSTEETDSRDMIMKFSSRSRLIVYKNSKSVVHIFSLLFEGSARSRGRWKKREMKNKSGKWSCNFFWSENFSLSLKLSLEVNYVSWNEEKSQKWANSVQYNFIDQLSEFCSFLSISFHFKAHNQSPDVSRYTIDLLKDDRISRNEVENYRSE